MMQINRNIRPGNYSLADIFPDIGLNSVLSKIFRSEQEIEAVLSNTVVIITDKDHYMFVDNNNGSITIGLKHLLYSDVATLYLDIIHELVHVRQQRDGLDLYDQSKAYVDRETEIEAYALALKEARRIGLTEKEILNYLWVEWITPEEHMRLDRTLKVKI